MRTPFRNIILFALLFSNVFIVSCEKEPSSNGGSLPTASQRKLIIGNEGSFGTNTATLSVVNLENDRVSNKVFESVNNEAIGDVLQSVSRVNNHYYFLVNNSHKIIVTDTQFTKVTEIKNIRNPRYLLQVSPTTAYVSSIYEGKIYIIDLNTHTKLNEIVMEHPWSEQMVLHSDATGSYALVCEKDTAVNYITKINVATGSMVDKINIGVYSPSQISKSSDGYLWVLSGNYYDRQSALTALDLSSNTIMKQFQFPAQYTAGQLATGPLGEKYITVVDYNTNEHGVYKFEKGATEFPTSFFVPTSTNEHYYGVGVDPTTAEVYISDTKGFTQAGLVTKYASDGSLLKSWTCGLGPSNFYFVQ